MAVIALGLGLLVVGVTATGYDLIKMIDHLFVEHVYKPQGAKSPRTYP